MGSILGDGESLQWMNSAGLCTEMYLALQSAKSCLDKMLLQRLVLASH